jgi:hypothetical protein
MNMSKLWLKSTPGNTSQSELKRIQDEKASRPTQPQQTQVPDTKVEPTLVEETPVPQPTLVQSPPEPIPHTPVVRDITQVWRTLVQTPGQWTAQPNELSDKILQLLDVYEQSILQRLYRLSWGYHQDTCRVGYDKLAKSCNMSRSKVQRSIDSLMRRGLITRVEYDFGNSVKQERGIVYRVNLPPADLSSGTKVQRTQVQQTKVPDTPNKERVKKQKLKVDVSLCPDCTGTGMYYPDGYDKGVKRCPHEKLKPAGERPTTTA